MTPHERSLDLTGTATASARARETAAAFLAESVRRRGRPASPAASDAVLLVASELVTNAVRHAPGPCTLRLTAHEEAVVVEVTDTNPAPPEPRAPDITGRQGGWGWKLVTRLADDVRVLPGPDGGKTVSTRLPW
ncbi:MULTISPECIES: ATP-binding protein [Streptomyces]|uniref:Histidine kinase/HSP90-like ATPase domain-containing protein n=2 Tax=Streptomyces TaxID=1883 RepID=A0A100YAI0_9ACTN|nr:MULTISPECIES: ATP-binding protein [Streptomyces]KUH40714.1 hypothetical protein ATE80_00570 [Streptomyces kanasensis]UUS29436.1 ATP-binding protein [Streptomyces changanensis]